MEEKIASPDRECLATTPDTGMNPGIDNTGAKPVIFRNSRFFIAWIMFFGVAGMAIGLGMTVAAYQEFFTHRHYVFIKALNVIQWAGGSFLTASLGLTMCRVGLRMTYYQARLDSRGVDFRLGSRKSPQEQFFSWDEIAAVKHKRIPNNEYYAVIGKDNRLADFTIYTFFRAKKLARQIAANASQSIQEIGS